MWRKDKKARKGLYCAGEKDGGEREGNVMDECVSVSEGGVMKSAC